MKTKIDYSFIPIRVTTEFKTFVKSMAASEHRNTSNYIKYLIFKDAQEKGIKIPEGINSEV